MTSDGAEYRFWAYADTTNQNRYVSDTGSVFEMRLNTSGQVMVYTKRTATGYTANTYTAVGTYGAGWTEYRIVLDFTTDTYTLFTRTDAEAHGRSSRRRARAPTTSPCARRLTAPRRRTCCSARTERGHVARRRELLRYRHQRQPGPTTPPRPPRGWPQTTRPARRASTSPGPLPPRVRRGRLRLLPRRREGVTHPSLITSTTYADASAVTPPYAYRLRCRHPRQRVRQAPR